MKTRGYSHRIRLFTSCTPVGRVWNVSVGNEHQAIFAGDNGKTRALAYAWRQAELLRTTGSVMVVVDTGDQPARSVVSSRLAS